MLLQSQARADCGFFFRNASWISFDHYKRDVHVVLVSLFGRAIVKSISLFFWVCQMKIVPSLRSAISDWPKAHGRPKGCMLLEIPFEQLCILGKNKENWIILKLYRCKNSYSTVWAAPSNADRVPLLIFIGGQSSEAPHGDPWEVLRVPQDSVMMMVLLTKNLLEPTH